MILEEIEPKISVESSTKNDDETKIQELTRAQKKQIYLEKKKAEMLAKENEQVQILAAAQEKNKLTKPSNNDLIGKMRFLLLMLPAKCFPNLTAKQRMIQSQRIIDVISYILIILNNSLLRNLLMLLTILTFFIQTSSYIYTLIAIYHLLVLLFSYMSKFDMKFDLFDKLKEKQRILAGIVKLLFVSKTKIIENETQFDKQIVENGKKLSFMMYFGLMHHITLHLISPTSEILQHWWLLQSLAIILCHYNEQQTTSYTNLLIIFQSFIVLNIPFLGSLYGTFTCLFLYHTWSILSKFHNMEELKSMIFPHLCSTIVWSLIGSIASYTWSTEHWLAQGTKINIILSLFWNFIVFSKLTFHIPNFLWALTLSSFGICVWYGYHSYLLVQTIVAISFLSDEYMTIIT